MRVDCGFPKRRQNPSLDPNAPPQTSWVSVATRQPAEVQALEERALGEPLSLFGSILRFCYVTAGPTELVAPTYLL